MASLKARVRSSIWAEICASRMAEDIAIIQKNPYGVTAFRMTCESF